jgi:hypothetical protein
VGRLLRRYDARDHVSRFATPGDPAVRPMLLFLAHLAVLVACTLVRHRDEKPYEYHALDLVTLLIVTLSAAIVFPLMVRAARRYMEHVRPTLPTPRHEPRDADVTAGT